MLGIINAYSRREVYLEVGVGLLIGTTGKFLGGPAPRKERGFLFSGWDECTIGEYGKEMGPKVTDIFSTLLFRSNKSNRQNIHIFRRSDFQTFDCCCC